MSNTWVIGDLHGGLRALLQLLERAPILENDELIFLGDYVDGWSESAQLVDFLMDLEDRFRCVFIKGNHDVYCRNWLKNGDKDPIWLKHGGLSTIESYRDISEEKKIKHLHFFERLSNYFVDPANRLFIHAGFTSMQGPYHEFHKPMYNWDRTLWELALAMDKSISKDSKFYPKRLLLFNEIFIGHTPTLYCDIKTPMNACNVWNIDTGAAFTGSASILNVDSKAFFQSDPLYKLYPNERGRN